MEAMHRHSHFSLLLSLSLLASSSALKNMRETVERKKAKSASTLAFFLRCIIQFLPSRRARLSSPLPVGEEEEEEKDNMFFPPAANEEEEEVNVQHFICFLFLLWIDVVEAQPQTRSASCSRQFSFPTTGPAIGSSC